jgi:serine/threonine-protein kinase
MFGTRAKGFISITRVLCAVLLLVQVGCGKSDKSDGNSARATRDSATQPSTESDVTAGTADDDTETTSEDGDTEVTRDGGAPSALDQYGVLKTIAGTCGIGDKGENGWQPQFEGGPAVQAELSRPHFAMADEAGNIFIADKDAHAVRKIDPEGNIHTVAGTGEAGDDGDEPGPGNERRLYSPNGIWVFPDSTVFILDLENHKVRRLDPSGEMTTLFTSEAGISIGRGLWVQEDEQLVYYASNSKVVKWTPANGEETFMDGFISLGNLVVDPSGALVVTDRSGNRVYRIDEAGGRTAIAGTGETTGGGSGMPALQTALHGVRGVWFLDDGGYFLATHEGNQVWFVDTSGIIHLFLDGAGDAHAGDGGPYDTPGQKVSEVRGISVSPVGDLIITEHDCGYIRVVERILE